MRELWRIMAGTLFLVSSMVTIGYLLECDFDAVCGPAVAMFTAFVMLLIGQVLGILGDGEVEFLQGYYHG